MKTTADLFEAFLKCPTTCWLRATGELPTGNTYAQWVQAQNESFRAKETERLLAETPPGESARSPSPENLKASKWRLAVDLPMQTSGPLLPRSSRRQEAQTSSPLPSNLNSQPADQSLVTSAATHQGDGAQSDFIIETRLHAVERVPSEGRGRAAQFIPVRFIFRNKLTKDDRLLLAFDTFVLSAALGREIALGRIIHGDDHATLKVKTSALAGEVRKSLDKLAALLSSPAPPDLVLNRHCAECEFQARCRQKAVQKDDLSLLAGMSAKERQKLRSKGIFTVTQLSYTFRPRRRPKKLRNKREKYHHSLKALAIREKKIHIVGSPELKIEGTPVYLDVEGLPDRDFYYLIGLRIGNGESAVQHSLWADTVEDEGKIWREFLGILKTVEKPVLIHYGSYETTFLHRMCERYGEPAEGSVAAKAIQTAVNLLSVTFAQVYFPTFSNGLKEIAGNLGFRWSDPTATGIRTVVWRQEWEASRVSAAKQGLITYNAEDCAALEAVAHKFPDLHQSSPQAGIPFHGEVVDTAKLKREHPYGFKRNTFAFPEMNAINNAAYWDYQRERVYVKSGRSLKHAVRRKARSARVLPPNKTVECARPRYCPRCNSRDFFKHTKHCKTVFDLKFMRCGVKRWITRYRFHWYQCQKCGAVFPPEEKSWARGTFGSEIIAYALYLNIELRLPQMHVDQSLNRLFGFDLAVGQATQRIKEQAAKTYRDTYEALLKGLCSGRLLHADETKISIRGNDGFVWVFANMEEVAYVYSETREGDLLQTMLKDFKGVLVSDFYAAYDAIQCPQQKCLIHLIRDLNDDVLKHPYDEELKRLALAFAVLLKPMVETIDRYGLKCHFLRKHLSAVDGFYRQISELTLHSETAVKLKERLEKNRDKLFTFLNFDGVPWNNNNAEHAVKPFAKLRHIIGGVTTEKGIQDYLVLLSLCETCKYIGLDFLDFLRSGEKDIHAFAESRPGRRRRSPIREPKVPPADAPAGK
jgi:predicted RecB family nuclease